MPATDDADDPREDERITPVAGGTGDPGAVATERMGPTWACLAVSVAGFVAIVAYVLGRNPGLWFDEAWYLETAARLREDGPSIAWLRDLKGPAGPLFGVVHALLSPLTGLRPPGIRVVSMGFSVLTVLALGYAMRSRRVPHAFPKAAALLAVPMLYGSIGTAMTEMPAMFFACVSLACLLAALDRDAKGDRGAYPLAILAGLACGVATIGRQPYLIAGLASAVLVLTRAWRIGLIYGLVAVALPVPLFLVWGGVIPPESVGRQIGGGISIPTCLDAFAYAGVTYCLFDVGWVLRRPVLFAAIVALTTAANVATGYVLHYPMHIAVIHYLSPTGLYYYGLIVTGVMLGFGAGFLVELTRIAWERRGDPGDLYMWAATMLLLLASVKNSAMFTGRYIATTIPMLMILAAERTPDTYGKAVRLALGCAVGIVSLNAYFKTV